MPASMMAVHIVPYHFFLTKTIHDLACSNSKSNLHRHITRFFSSLITPLKYLDVGCSVMHAQPQPQYHAPR